MRRPAAVVLSVVAVLAVGCSSGEAEWEESVHELAALDFFGFEGGAQSNAIDCAEVGYDADVALERVAADTKAANDSLASSGPEVLTPPLVDRARETGAVPDDVTDQEILAVWAEYIWTACIDIASQ